MFNLHTFQLEPRKVLSVSHKRDTFQRNR